MSEKELTVEISMADFKAAYRAKGKLIERQQEDFRFALGEQWDKEDVAKLKEAGFKAFTDNRIAPNIFLLTGLERQNRTDFKAFPEGEEDGLKSEIASALFKHAIKTSDFAYKSSDQFKDGVTCGESHLELYLDYTDNLLNGTPRWKKLDGNAVFPAPGFREYDFNDAAYVYKFCADLSLDEIVNLFPDKREALEAAKSGKLGLDSTQSGQEEHLQRRDYPKRGESTGSGKDEKDGRFDLLERYYKKWVEKAFVGDKQTGKIEESETPEKADRFVSDYKASVQAEEEAYAARAQEFEVASAIAIVEGVQPPQAPVHPSAQDPGRFIVIKKKCPEIWCFAHVPGMDKPLADERAWFFPKWKSYPFIPYFARFSTAPLKGDDRHLLVQGVVHGVKGAQEKHNKSEMLALRHLNSAANGGWLTPIDGWADRNKVDQFGSAPGVNLEYDPSKGKPERIFPMPLSQGHAQIAAESAESIKAQLGINADLLAAQDGSSQSGRAIALRQRQGLLMVQELFDNLSRTRQIAGRFMLSQLGEMYDTETAQKVLGDAFLVKNFPPMMIMDEATGQPTPMPGKDGRPMRFDSDMAEVAIAEVLSGDLWNYDVSVGEAVASETMRMANSAEVREIAQTYPGLIGPDILVESSQLPQSTKTRILASIQAAQAAALKTPPQPGKGPQEREEEAA